jgi:hypothetical protein
VDCKNKYEEIVKGEVDMDSYTEDEVGEFMDFLTVGDFDTQVLHTIILFDDATDMFRNKSDPMRTFLLRNRHHKFTYFLNVHSYTGDAIPQMVKKSLRSLWYFGGFSKFDFDYSYWQFKAPIEKEELYSRYKHLSKRDVLFLDYRDEGTKIKVINLG